jgi:hypothetical protein
LDLNLTLTKKQKNFIDSEMDEVLFGGAAGGGKSYAQLIDALLFALKYQGSRQLILRRTFPELRRSLMQVSLTLFPREFCTYNDSKKQWSIKGGSIIEFGYCDSESDVTQYQSAEYDCIRFDELTHFTEFMYTYLISRIRGVNPFPKQIKSSTNPGGIGHAWVKARFIDGHDPGIPWTDDLGRTRIFIPAKVQENRFLMESDPKYLQRLEQLPENQRKALLHGEWDIFEGQFFSEFRNNTDGYLDRKHTHVCEPFPIPRTWTRYRSFDWGFSKPFSVQWWAVDQDDRAFLYREWYGCSGEPDVGLRITPDQVARKIVEIEKELEPDGIYIDGIADPAIWDVQTGESIAETMAKAGVHFRKGDNKRLSGWMQVRERLKFDEDGMAAIFVFKTCPHAIRTIPMQVHDAHKPEDLDTKLEDHACDSMRYFCMARPVKPRTFRQNQPAAFDPLQAEKQRIISGLGFIRNY